TPFNQTPASKISAQVMEELLAFVDNFDSARFNLADAIFRGSTYGYIEGERRVLSLYDGIPRFWWVPTAIRDLTKFRIRQVPKLEGEGKNRSVRVDLELWSVAREDWEPLREENRRAIIQHLYNDTEERLGYGHGLVDQMYHYWRAKEIVLTENLAAVERFAQGLLIAKIDSARLTETGNPNTAQVENFIAALEKHKARHILAVDKDDEVEMISPSGEGHQLFESMRNYLDNALRTLIIGANLTSSANEGGSYALADVQADSTQHLINYDRRILGQSLTRSLVKLVWDLNAENFRQLGLGDALPPRFTIVDEKIPDSKKEAEITQILLAAGVKQKADEVYELCGRTQPGPGDEVIEPTPAPSPFGPPGTDFGAPFGQDKGAKGEPGESSESAFKRGVEAAAAMYAAQFAGTKTTQAQPITVNVAPPSTTVQNYE
ncbi:MAG TPA: hypothetical protein DEH78_23385, partial [Solibacterales bacterium]|nr:hypothetical protein [Bryobacterales bacterium]